MITIDPGWFLLLVVAGVFALIALVFPKKF
jgi:hypothetical protein